MKTESCDQCGDCCSLFYVNLNQSEYKYGNFKTIFGQFESMKNFTNAAACGANFLAKNKDGSCVYLKDRSCSIHSDRPEVCRAFFCKSNNEEFSEMRKLIIKHKS